MSLFAQRTHAVKPSPTLAVAAQAQALKAQGLDIISLGAGEPDFDTPDFIKEATIQALRAGKTKYTAVEGTKSLREAIVDRFKLDLGLAYEPKHVLVSSGAKQSIYNAMQALLNPGDEVLIPCPYWVSYPDMALLAEAQPRFIQTGIEQKFKIQAEQLKKAIGSKTRLFILNSPSNPSGMAYTESELLALAEVLEKHPQVWIISDDIYQAMQWTPQAPHLLKLAPQLKDRCLVVHGVSKTYAMTGFRIGYAAGSADWINTMSMIQSQSTSNPCSLSQAAAEAALRGDQSCVDTMRQAFKARHDYLVPALNNIKGIECLLGDGTFYAFPKVQGLIQRLSHLGINNDLDLARLCLEKAHVAMVPGSAFGSPGYLRLSFASALNDLKAAIGRLEQYLV